MLLSVFLEVSCGLIAWVATTGAARLWSEALVVVPRVGLGQAARIRAARTSNSFDDHIARLLFRDEAANSRAWRAASDAGLLALTLASMTCLTGVVAGRPPPATSAAGVLATCAAAWTTAAGITVPGTNGVLAAWYACTWLVSRELKTLRRTFALHGVFLALLAARVYLETLEVTPPPRTRQWW